MILRIRITHRKHLAQYQARGGSVAQLRHENDCSVVTTRPSSACAALMDICSLLKTCLFSEAGGRQPRLSSPFSLLPQVPWPHTLSAMSVLLSQRYDLQPVRGPKPFPQSSSSLCPGGTLCVSPVETAAQPLPNPPSLPFFPPELN